MTLDLLDLGPPQPWMADAACPGVDPEIFFPARGDTLAAQKAKAVCSGCPVRAACLDWILDVEAVEGGQPGIYAGLTDTERRPLRVRRCRVPGCRVVLTSPSSRYCFEHSVARRRQSRADYDHRRRLSA